LFPKQPFYPLRPHSLRVPSNKSDLFTFRLTPRTAGATSWGCHRRNLGFSAGRQQTRSEGELEDAAQWSNTPSANNFKTMLPDLFKLFWKAPSASEEDCTPFPSRWPSTRCTWYLAWNSMGLIRLCSFWPRPLLVPGTMSQECFIVDLEEYS
jgi:hypothetical protein